MSRIRRCFLLIPPQLFTPTHLLPLFGFFPNHLLATATSRDTLRIDALADKSYTIQQPCRFKHDEGYEDHANITLPTTQRPSTARTPTPSPYSKPLPLIIMTTTTTRTFHHSPLPTYHAAVLTRNRKIHVSSLLVGAAELLRNIFHMMGEFSRGEEGLRHPGQGVKERIEKPDGGCGEGDAR